ncbi:MAG: threonine synthase [Ignavibacteriae bacterium]|nr:threonine synthase [Ignavibacteriota bacterium]
MNFSPPPFVTGLKCLICGATYPHSNILTCPSCGIEGILDVLYDYSSIDNSQFTIRNSQFSHWRYKALLPISPDLHPPFLTVGWTPVYDAKRLAKHLGIRKLFLKDDGRNPSNSFKDRASSVGVLKAIEFGFKTIACASTGNAASSLACMSAAVGLQSFIFVPSRAPEPKVTQLLIFGATVIKVQGTYEQAFDLCREACEKFGWYNRNSGTNPYLVEGKKTAGLEIAEQMKDEMPDWVVVSVGDGCTIGGIGKGLQEMKQLGFIERVPKLLGVQAEGAKPMLEAFQSGKDLVPSETNTIADSIAVGTPRNWRRAIHQIKQSNGEMIAVSDEEILEAMRVTARLGGVFGEPAGIAGVAGVKKAIQQNIIKSHESVLAVITGNGLKDVQSAKQAAGEALSIKPNIDALANALSAHLKIN